MDRVRGNTPVLVGAGQYTEHGASPDPPVELAARAARAALADTGVPALVRAIDTVLFVRLFSDSSKASVWACPFGRSDNPPESVARRIGAAPRTRIYSAVGGNEPQSRLIEMARDIAAGERECVLLTGAEAARNQRQAQRAGQVPDWSERHDAPLEDRGYGPALASRREIANGLVMPVYYYTLIEQARALARGHDTPTHRAGMAQLMASFSAVAKDNPYAQFPGVLDAVAIDAAPPLTHLYSRRMVAQDGVNQGSALLMTSVRKALESGIPPGRLVYLHGAAEGVEPLLPERPDPGESPVAGAVLQRALAIAGRDAADIGPIDLYSCFPCAVSAVAGHLGLPDDGSRALTLTGGLPYFGGPGNNYSMHGIAEMVLRLRREPASLGLVSACGGMLSKHAVGIYSCQPSRLDWSTLDVAVPVGDLARKPLADAPSAGRVLSWSLNWVGDEPGQAVALAETDAGERFVCCAQPGDAATLAAVQRGDAGGRRITVQPYGSDTLYFRFLQS